MNIKTDCKYYRGDKPCEFHKLDGRICKDCRDYYPISTQILIMKLESLGDVLRTTSILPAIKNQYPNSQITWITKKEASSLLENNSVIDKILTVEDNYLEFLLNQKYDISISLDLGLLSATINAICKSSMKKGFITDKKGRVKPVNKDAEEWYLMSMNDTSKRLNRKTYFEHIYSICGLKPPYYKPQYELTQDQEEFANQYYRNKRLERFQKIIGINTGGGGRWHLKRWILEYYIELVNLIKENHPSIGLLLYGGKLETEFNRKIVETVGNLIIDTGCNNSIEEFASLISLSDILLTPDSLGMHLGTAFEKICVAMVGPSSPWEIDLFGKGDIIYNKEMDCIGCYLPSCKKTLNCMNSLVPEKVCRIFENYIKDEHSNS